MKLIRLTDGRDIVDMRGYPGFPTADEDKEGKFIFHALNSVSPKTTPENRGVPVEVSDARAEEMLTHPTARFEVVTAKQAEADRYRRTLTRDMFGNLHDPKTGAIVDTTVATADTAPAEFPTEDTPAGEPSSPEEVRASVAATLAAAEAEAAPTATKAKAATK